MQIASEVILAKMEDLLRKARNSPEDGAEKYIIAIHSLCELMLEKGAEVPAPAVRSFRTPEVKTAVQPSIPQAEPKRIEGANGSSLLDF
ncbi:YwdI family protein [Peribacillus kribbensis]|uniref:YwdI family protein n=1 Tax=Peribacillus kribbensis TaxID=356658 RepID=UPI00042709D1|nr:YwdI family protein [Peribacillus kribbensis]